MNSWFSWVLMVIACLLWGVFATKFLTEQLFNDSDVARLLLAIVGGAVIGFFFAQVDNSLNN